MYMRQPGPNRFFPVVQLTCWCMHCVYSEDMMTLQLTKGSTLTAHVHASYRIELEDMSTRADP
jgi:hypothetical protein